MRPLAIFLLVLCWALPCTPRRLAAQATSCPAMPDSLLGYRLTQTHTFPDTASGVGYRFAGPPEEKVDVYVYPIPADVRTGTDPQAWVNAEGAKFEHVLPIGVQRGWYQSYRLAVAEAEPVSVDSIKVPGFFAAAATKTGEHIAVEIFYLYAACGRFLNVRATLDGRTWTESQVPTFAKALAASQIKH